MENKTSHYLYLISGTKRYYPYASLAAQALGFVNAEGGAYGIEAVYDDVLEGTAGRVVTTKTGSGTQMYNSYSEFIDAVDGYDLTLTIDATIQSYLEKTLEEGIRDYDVREGAFAIAMDPNTGAILGIASSPDFDPNNYSLIADDLLNQEMEANTAQIYEQLKANNTEGLSDAELLSQAESQAYASAVNAQWRSKAINDRYEPGSTFKALVLAAALEEGVVSESDTFTCTGSVMVPGYDKPIRCSSARATAPRPWPRRCSTPATRPLSPSASGWASRPSTTTSRPSA
ncbi:MAG: penicillin-binding transpeptidase domain-containing protein [Lawsonibacter sp.]